MALAAVWPLVAGMTLSPPWVHRTPVVRTVAHVAPAPSPAMLHRRAIAAQTARELSASARRIGVTVPALRSMWQRVAICEVGGRWSMVGPVYSGIGFANTTWSSFGGSHFASVAGLATRDQQIVIAMRVTGGWIPDQYGCARW